MSTPLRLLIVEDCAEDAELLLAELKRGGFEPLHERVETARAMRDALGRKDWEIIISDYALPQFSGLEALAMVKDRGLDIPFILISGTIGEEIAVEAMKAGVHDYLMKGKLARLAPAIKGGLEKAANRRKQRELEEKLQHDALHDALTGLPNRALFMDRLGQCLRRSKRDREYSFAVLFLDLDRFKLVNDGLGHILGDQLLVETARRLERCIRPGDTVARMGGDEFTILLEGMRSAESVVHVTDRIQKELKAPVKLETQEVFATASIGIAMGKASYERPEEVLRDADAAMYRAKSSGRARHDLFDNDLHKNAVAQLQMESDLRRAIERNELAVHYQPIVTLETGRIRGFEALVRWNHPQQGLIAPGKFIHVAEESGLIVPIDRWVLREATRQLGEWQKRFPLVDPLYISVNFSGKQFWQHDLALEIERILKEVGLNRRSLSLEITEGVLMQTTDAAVQVLWDLRTMGTHLSLDDFGTGYSSLNYLHNFPIDVLKIDRSFVARMATKDEGREIVRAIVTLAHNLGIQVVAEGIETEHQLGRLREMKCEFGQGTIFSWPVDAPTAEGWITNGMSFPLSFP